MSRSPSLHKPMTREEVARVVLHRIVSGAYAPGQRLESQARLRPGISPNLSMTTLNAGLRILKDMGFLDIRRQHSTRVADPLPYRNRIGVVFPLKPDMLHATTMFSVQLQVVMNRQHMESDPEYRVYYGSSGEGDHSLEANAATFDTLREDIRWHRLAAILYCSKPKLPRDDLIYAEPGFPRACLAGWEPDLMPPMPHIKMESPEHATFMSMALNSLKARGMRKIAVLFYGPGRIFEMDASPHPMQTEWLEAVSDHGLETRPEWMLFIARSAREITRLLMTGREVPDAVVITDDILVEAVTAGLRDAGAPYPDVVALCNFPVLPNASVPTRFLGYDIEALFERCRHALFDPEAQRSATEFRVSCIFDDEWRKRSASSPSTV